MKKSLFTKILIAVSGLVLLIALSISVIAGLHSNRANSDSTSTYQNNPFN